MMELIALRALYDAVADIDAEDVQCEPGNRRSIPAEKWDAIMAAFDDAIDHVSKGA